ncbi:MAG: ATP-binding protein [Anaerohalosphaeraceae bacterium]|nr:ATP-binding protein [Anaerohalosphaeraceae bacterium]
MTSGCTHEKIVSRGVVSDLRKICDKILSIAVSLKYSKDDIFAMHLAMEEAFINAVKHGNNGDIEKNVTIDYTITPEKFDISVIDEGSGFTPETLADPRAGDNLFKTSGRGVLLIKSYMDFVEHAQNGRLVHMVKKNTNKAIPGKA